MLKIVELSLLAVSLLVVIGLIVSGSRSGTQPSTPPSLANENPEAQEHGKTL
jgi:hypothetical protein